MAEVFVWPEGSAYIWSGNSTTSALLTFARRATVRANVLRHEYRPPYSVGWTYIDLQTRRAALDITQAFSQKAILNYVQNGTGGQIHCHITHLESGGGLSGGMFLWTGSINAETLDGGDGGEIALSINGMFDAWSAY